MKVLIVYDTWGGNTEKMAKAVGEGARAAGADVEVKSVKEATLSDLEAADAIILGSPTHFGTMSDGMKKFINDSVKIRGKLVDKIGAAFTSSGHPFGGNETTLLSLLQAMLIHGMLVVGDPLETGGHYGAVAVGTPDEKALEDCRKLGKRVAELARRLAASR
ncbi:MAG TPA: flavodoxin family protein [Methanomicrobia archaeon]|nr:flavodoxin family protein [Methanomicrobia archaeon]HEX58675.1 flavodoxin family protein [Methanomicrobia archaeon]